MLAVSGGGGGTGSTCAVRRFLLFSHCGRPVVMLMSNVVVIVICCIISAMERWCVREPLQCVSCMLDKGSVGKRGWGNRKMFITPLATVDMFPYKDTEPHPPQTLDGK